uniref:pectinesterase n=1 Tax=Rhizophora mucronata TaxID=61149 RepID=A0A2P2Q5W6_RHIMU
MEVSILGRALTAVLFLQLSIYIFSSLATRPLPKDIDTEYIETSCNFTLYPHLCYNSLSSYANEIKTNPQLLVDTALNVTLVATESTSKLMKNLSKLHDPNTREGAAWRDCVEEIGDSVYELQRSLGEMSQAGGQNSEIVKSDVQTWVSAALTDDDTCMDGFDDWGTAVNVEVMKIVRTHVVKIAHLTSNVLALVNNCA